MRTMLLVFLLFGNGERVDLSYAMYDSVAECEKHIDMAINWGRKQPDVKFVSAVCTTKLRPVTEVVAQR